MDSFVRKKVTQMEQSILWPMTNQGHSKSSKNKDICNCFKQLGKLNSYMLSIISSIYDRSKYMNPHGKITQLYIWARLLSDQEMIDFTSNCNFIVNKSGEKSYIVIGFQIPYLCKKKVIVFLSNTQISFLIGMDLIVKP